MTDKEVQAEEDAWERKYQEQLAAAEAAFQERHGQPPRQSRVNGPPADWKRWCALLDGVPVGSCWAYDVDAGWVEVWVIDRGSFVREGRMKRVVNQPRRRLYGKVEAIAYDGWLELKKKVPPLEVFDDEERGEPVPGTEIRE